MLIITTPVDLPAFERLLGDGSRWGMTIQYAIQPSPDGLAQAFLIGADFLAGASAALLLGDNLFHGHDLIPQLAVSNGSREGATVYAYPVPARPKSRYAVTGLYFYDHTVVERVRKVELMGRGMAWLDTGTCDSLHEAGSYIRALEHRQGLKVGCPEEVAWRQGWISGDQLERLALPLKKSGYGDYLLGLQQSLEVSHAG